MRRETPLVDHIAYFFEASAHRLPGSAVIVAGQVRHVFKDEELGLSGLQDVHDVVEQGAEAAAPPSLLASGLGEGLAGKAGAKDVVVGNRIEGNLPDVTSRLDAEILAVQQLKM